MGLENIPRFWGKKGVEERSDALEINVLQSGSSTTPSLQYIKIKNNGIAGTGNLKFCLYSSFDLTQEPILCSESLVSVTDAELAELNIFPNPANDYFQITDNSEITSLQIYDIVGKKVMDKSHTNGKQYDISELRNGLYIVRLIDKAGSQVKSLRLSKR